MIPSRPRRHRAAPSRLGLSAALLVTSVLAVGPLVAPTPAAAAPAAAPTITGASSALGDTTVSFTQGSTGGSAISNYEFSVGSGAFTPLSPADTTSPITLPGVGINESVRIRAINADGTSGASNAFLTPFEVEYLVVGGGGAGGPDIGGGGGAGGMLEGTTVVAAASTTVTVGAGGSGCSGGCVQSGAGVNGANSVFGSVVATGGGGGGGKHANGRNGGSGGGSGHNNTTGGSGIAGQGSNASPSNNVTAAKWGASGGAGKTGSGAVGTTTGGGVGGAGQASSITGTSVTYAGGGGGATGGNGINAAGGVGGGGEGGEDTIPCSAGAANTGGGGGGRGPFDVTGCSGGSGVVVVRYFGPQQATGGTVTSSGGYTIHRFASSGTFTKDAPVLPLAPSITADRSPVANAEGWNNEPVTVSFTCVSDYLVSCPPATTLSTDSASHSVNGTATDVYGSSSGMTVGPIRIDTVAPDLSTLATTAPNGAGWYNAPVTMAWTCADALSGIAPGACPAADVLSSEGSAVSSSATVSDRAGNVGSGSSETVKIDLTAPSTGVSSAPTWSTADVPVTFSPVDGLSGVASTTFEIDGGATQSGTTAVVSGEGSHTVTYRSVDEAGNIEETKSTTINIDLSAPSIVADVSPAANANGWHNGPVTVSFTCDDGASGVASCTPDETLSTEVDTTVTGTAVDNVGRTASASATVRIDLTAPTGVAQVPAPTANGWFNAPVEVPFSCSDTGGSGVATCPAPVVIAGEGADQAVTGTVTDNAGNSASVTPGSVSLDTTAPTISGAALEAMNGDGGYTAPVTVRWTCDDALSGVVSCPADEVVTGEGIHVVTASVTDRAGNTSSASVTIRIDADTSNDPGTVHGIVRNSVTGEPLAGIMVRLHVPYTGVTVSTTTSGTDGSYVFPMVPDGTYQLTGTKWGVYLQSWYPDVHSSGPAELIDVGLGTNKTADINMVPGFVLEGQITSSETGEPISGATVVLSTGTSAVTDAAGNYALPGLSFGNPTATIVAYGYETVTVPNPVPGNLTLNRALVPSGPSAGIKGTITKGAGNTPVPGAKVRIWSTDAKTFGATITTGASGRYELPSLPAGSYQVDVVKPANATRWAPAAGSRSGASSFTITTACAAAPDTSWGDPCATPVDVHLP